MKNKFKYLERATAAALFLSSLFVSCEQEDAPFKGVDLRFEVDDEYNITHTAPEAIVFRVRSSEEWEVFSNNPEWSTITPSTGEGDPVYDPDKDYNVTVQYNNNTHLDDRVDTLNIKSDYWVGKRVIVTQKGIAYLNVDLAPLTVIAKSGGETSFAVNSNQDWTSKVTEGDSWLSIKSSPSGSFDGEITVESGNNFGERRTGIVSLYDRHGVERQRVEVVQDGFVLDISSESIRAYHEAQTITIPIESNGDWFVVKEQETVSWYEFETTNFSGNSELKIILGANEGSSTRKAKIIVSSMVVEGIEPVVKEITIRQAYLPTTTRNEFTPEFFSTFRLQNGSMANMTASGTVATFKGGFNRIAKDNVPLGRYTFSVKATSSGGQPNILFYEAAQHIQLTLLGSGVATFTGTNGISIPQQNFDKEATHTIGLEYSENLENGLCNIEWFLNGVSAGKYIANPDSGFRRPWGEPVGMLIFGNTGSGDAEYHWMEYTPAINWGE